jgi:putative ABC transport system permease protein
MNFLENIREGLRSIQANLLRSVLTALIVAIGIMSLVGTLTAIDGIEVSVTESLATLGGKTFDITSKENRGSTEQGVVEKTYPQLRMNEAFRFIDQFNLTSDVSLSANLTQIAEVKRLSNKTNPNVFVYGVNEQYLGIKGLQLTQGRNFSPIEIQYGTPAAILGYKIYQKIYKENELIDGSEVTFSGNRFRVIGVIEEKGDFAEDNYDNMVLIPIVKANQMSQGRGLWYQITVSVTDPSKIEYFMGEATGIMRNIRQDPVGKPNSFELERSETLEENMAEITNGLRIGGFVVGFVTLLGASIALMNIMLVSVTERTREVGVRKALGATPLLIRQQFVIEALVVCLIGGIAGVVMGIAIGNLLSRLMGITTFVVPWVWMIFGLFICVVVGLLSGYYPAQKASKLDPIESLRFE